MPKKSKLNECYNATISQNDTYKSVPSSADDMLFMLRTHTKRITISMRYVKNEIPHLKQNALFMLS